jgi:metallo-beta-lactamase family protein
MTDAAPAAGDARLRLRFLGAADSVTGSRYLLENDRARVLIDCGLYQGYKVLRERNWAPFPVDPSTIDAVLLTHAHLDHTGYLPALVRDGFRGPVYATHGTAELCRIVLPDSGHLLEEEAHHWRTLGTSKHQDPRPLYTAADAVRALDFLLPVDFDRDIALPGDMVATFVPAGHILGAAQIRVRSGGQVVHFTGDLGRQNDPVMRPPRPLSPCDVLVTESTYGDRKHPLVDVEEELGETIRRVIGRGGVCVIPAFAVGRTESLLLHLARLRAAGKIPETPVYLNSPMALNATYIYRAHPEEHRVASDEFVRMYGQVVPVRTAAESKRLNERGGPMIIISASGMLTGGRVLHHVAAYGPDPANAILLTGFQAAGTRGARLAAGERSLRIFGEDVPIRAEVIQLDNLSAHADADELLAWMGAVSQRPRATFVTHGEPHSADTLRLRIRNELGWDAHVPDIGEIVALDALGPSVR